MFDIEKYYFKCDKHRQLSIIIGIVKHRDAVNVKFDCGCILAFMKKG